MNGRTATYVNKPCTLHSEQGCQATTFTCETFEMAVRLHEQASFYAETTLTRTFNTPHPQVMTLHFVATARTTRDASLLRNNTLRALRLAGWVLSNVTSLE